MKVGCINCVIMFVHSPAVGPCESLHSVRLYFVFSGAVGKTNNV